MSDPQAEIRDIGPYEDVTQALRQFGNWQVGLPMTNHEAALLLVRDSVLLAGVKVTPFEVNYLREHKIDPVLATIIHGWLIRARLAGQTASSPGATS